MDELKQVPLEEAVLQFDPPYPVYAIKLHPEEPLDIIVQEPLKRHEIKNRMRVAIPNPFKPGEERFLPGLAYGNGIEFVMEIGQSFGALGFNEDLGWYCHAMIPKTHVMSGVIKEIIQKHREAAKGSFTERLLKKNMTKTEE